MADSPEHQKAGQRKRIPNAQRSAATREKLIEATINCLYELGFHQTTTVIVAERAGVSRGAMLHQFPTKADLVMAAARRMTEMRGELHKERLSGLKSPEEKFLALTDVLWEAMLSPSGVARIELMLSTRSDPELADRFERLNDDLDRIHKERVWILAESCGLQGPEARAKIDAFVQLYAAAARGLAIDALRPASREDARKAMNLLKSFQVQLLQQMLGKTS